MRLSGLHIILIRKNGKPIRMDLFLGNEEAAELKGPFRALLESENTLDLIEGIEASFCYSDEPRCDLTDLREWDFEDAYDKFVSQMNRCGMKNVAALILLINTEFTGGDRRYEWLRYDYEKQSVTRGRASGVNESHLKTGEASPTVDEIIAALTAPDSTLRETVCRADEFDPEDDDDDLDTDDDDLDLLPDDFDLGDDDPDL